MEEKMKKCQLDFLNSESTCEQENVIEYYCKNKSLIIRIDISDDISITHTNSYKENIKQSIIQGCKEHNCYYLSEQS